MNVENKTAVPITPPPIMRSVDKILEGIRMATTKENMKSEIEAPPRTIPLSFDESGTKPGWPIITDTRTSRRYIASNIIAIEAVISDKVFLASFIVLVVFKS